MPKTVHDHLRARLLAQAGIVGFFRYGSRQSQIGKANYDNIGSILRRLSLYNKDHNREYLVDIANFAMIDFVTRPDYPFSATDDGVHTERLQ